MKRILWRTFGKTGGRSKRQIDRELRKKAMQSQISAPAALEERLDKLLAELPMDEPQQPVVPVMPERRQRNWYRAVMRPAFAVFAVIVFVSVGIVGNSSSDLDTRMEQMSDTEVAKYNEITQKAKVDADTYTREFTAEERQRMDELKMEYVSEGGYPAGNLLLLNTVSEWDGDTPAFAMLTSTFCVPDRELRDEELLEFMEFIYKREHSLEEMNATEAGQVPDATDDVEGELLEKSAKAVTETLGIDVSELEIHVQRVGDDKEYLITYREQNQNVCQVFVSVETGDVMEVSDMSLRAYGETKFEKSYIDEGLEQILESLSSGVWKGAEVEHVTVEYYLDETNNMLHDGSIRYLVELSDGSSYSCCYGSERQKLTGIRYMEETPMVETWYSMQDSTCEKLQLHREVESLK